MDINNEYFNLQINMDTICKFYCGYYSILINIKI